MSYGVDRESYACIKKDPALCGDMSDPYADGNGSKILPMFDSYADGKPKIWPHVRSKPGAEMAGRQRCPILNSYICQKFVPLSRELRAEHFFERVLVIRFATPFTGLSSDIAHCNFEF
jgi:hypothetical protein